MRSGFVRALWVAGLCAALAACGDNPSAPQGTGTPDAPPTPDVVVTPDSPPDLAPDTGQDADPDVTDSGDVAPDAPADVPEPDVTPDVPVDTDDTGEEEPADPILEVLEIEPGIGFVDGGTEVLVRISGPALVDPEVLFGTARARGVEVLADDTLRCVSPPGLPGRADVKVQTETQDAVLPGAFLYVERLQLHNILPASGSTQGGDVIRIEGAAFTEGVQVSFGGRAAIATERLDDTTLVAIAPPGVPGPADVRVTGTYNAATLDAGYRYLAPVTLEQLLPAAGPVGGGNIVVATGTGLTEDAEVLVGGFPAEVRFINGQRLELTMPAGAPGPADVEVFTAFGANGLPGGYVYIDAAPGELLVSTVQPAIGPAAGGQEVVISGAGFDEDGLDIRFDGAPAILIEVTDDALRVRTPTGSPGSVAVTVRHDGGEASLPAGYTYEPTLRLLAASPAAGPVEGGTEVTLLGEGFDAETEFHFGPIEAEVISVPDAGTAIVFTPPGSLGLAHIRATRDHQTAQLENGFRYTDVAEVTALLPGRGSIAGGTVLTVRGRGFTGEPDVQLGTATCAEIELIDQATIRCVTTPHLEGAVRARVTLDQNELDSPERYVYFHPATRFGGAWGGDVDGALNVSVYDVGGAPVSGAFVMLSVDGNTDHQGYTNVGGLITFSGDDVFGDQFVSATAAGYSSASVQAVNAENVTIFLFPTAPPGGGGGGGGLPLATIQGEVSGFQKIAQPGPDERQLIIVETTRISPGRPNPYPGQGNVVDPNGDRHYTLTARVGDLAVIAWGGLINDRTGVFTPYALGIRRYLFTSADEIYDVDLELTINLTQALQFKVNGAHTGPEGPTINRIEPWLDLGFEGFIGGYDEAEGNGNVIIAAHQAPLSRELADASYLAFGGSYTDQTAPYSIAYRTGITEIDGLIEMPTLVGTPSPLVPEAGGLTPNGYVAFEPATIIQPDFWLVQIYQLPATLVWEVTVPGNHNFFHLPRFPDFLDLPPEERPTPYDYSGSLYMVLQGAKLRPGFDYDQHEYLGDLRSRDNWQAWTRNAWFIRIE
jgi:hypothetical protein